MSKQQTTILYLQQQNNDLRQLLDHSGQAVLLLY